MSKKVARLVEQFRPEHYDLQLNVDRENMTFSGGVTIRGQKVGRPTQRLTFHQKGLKVSQASLTKHDKKGEQKVDVKRINNQNSLDEVRLHSDQMIYPGQYTVALEFSGTVTRGMHGIYPCFFKHDGQDKMLIATQFESHHAREAFPCIDEPEAKATFDLTLVTPAGETVIANTPIKSQKQIASKDGGQTAQTAKAGSTTPVYQITSFEITPKMSTYLLAFVYGEMGYKEAKTKEGVVVRTYATPDNVKLFDHGLDVAVRGLEFFSDYFGIAYPLPKLDLVALPDFTVGAMENWGLITFRETTMLVDPKHGSIESKQLVALVIAHELSHQWFGNLVTMKWWNDLWLNESFANMMEYLAVDGLYPEWEIWQQFVSHESAAAKRRDSLADVQPIKSDVKHPDEIHTLFDPSIVYAKGGTVLHMLMRYIGQSAFRQGLKLYFDKHSYGNTVAADLWDALSTASNQNVAAFMNDWLDRPGYPLVNVDWAPGESQFKVHQSRFLSDPTAKPTTDKPWPVPLAATQKLSTELLETRQAKLAVAEQNDQPLLLNHDGYSYFLPNYQQAAHRQQIVNGIKQQAVSVIDRLLLLDNQIMLQRGGIGATTDLLELLPAYADETSENVWGSVGLSVAEVRRLIETDEATEAKLDQLVGSLVIKMAGSLGWEDKPGDSAQTLRLRGLIMSMAAGAKAPTIIKEGLERFAKFSQPQTLSPSTRTVIYYLGARYGTMADFKKLERLYRTLKNADEKDEVASGLTAAKRPAQHKILLAMMRDDTVRRQDLVHWYVWMLRSRYSRAATWQWLKDNWDWIVQEFAHDKNYNSFPRYTGMVFSRSAELTDYKRFFGPKSSEVALAREIALGQQEITSRVAWRRLNESAVKKWLKTNVN